MGGREYLPTTWSPERVEGERGLVRSRSRLVSQSHPSEGTRMAEVICAAPSTNTVALATAGGIHSRYHCLLR